MVAVIIQPDGREQERDLRADCCSRRCATIACDATVERALADVSRPPHPPTMFPVIPNRFT